jgi:polysaccharide biosynthesis protein PslH
VPPRYGTANAILQDAQALATAHHVTLLQRADPDHIAPPPELDLVSSFRMPFFYGRFATLLCLFYLPLIYRLCRRRRIRVVLVESVFVGWIGPVLRAFLGVRFALRTHNIEGEKFRNLGKSGWRLLSWYERAVCRSADHVFFISPQDRQVALTTYGIPESRTSLVPYIIDTEAMRCLRLNKAERQSTKIRLGVPNTHSMFLFYGLLSYAPNVEALAVIESEIVPRLRKRGIRDVKIIVCGLGLDEERIHRYEAPDSMIRYAGFVPDINPVIASADVILNPILAGGGVKTKLIEAIALARPVVSTSTGARGVDRDDCGSALTVVDDGDWDAFVAAIEGVSTEGHETPDVFYETYSRKGAARLFAQGLAL